MPEEKPLIERVAAKLTKLRDARNLSRDVAAQKSGVGARSLQRWENAEQIPTGENLEKLAKFYGVSVSWITR